MKDQEKSNWNPDNRMVFMHIPKCAGQGFKKYVGRKIGRKNMYIVRDGREMREGVDSTNDRWFIAGHFGFQFIETFESPITKVTFLRDPVDRTLSHYYYWKESSKENPGPKAAKELTLTEFLLSDANPARMQVENLQTWALVSSHQRPFRKPYARFSDDELLDRALRNLGTFDFVGFSETFTDSFNELCRWYGWKTAKKTPPVNQTKKRRSRDMLTDEELAAIREVTHLDQHLYDIARYEMASSARY